MIKIVTKQLVCTLSILSGLLILTSCDSWMVGAPCKPETDDGSFVPNLKSTTYALETRSVQCRTNMCITKSEVRRPADVNNPSVQNKYSFCSCRCADKDGNKFDRNSDKYDDLCDCPSGSFCSEDVVGNIEEIPDAIKGSYCLPNCIGDYQTYCPERPDSHTYCEPPTDSEEPWKWQCKTRPL
jgi:hypothetical protein